MLWISHIGAGGGFGTLWMHHGPKPWTTRPACGRVLVAHRQIYGRVWLPTSEGRLSTHCPLSTHSRACERTEQMSTELSPGCGRDVLRRVTWLVTAGFRCWTTVHNCVHKGSQRLARLVTNPVGQLGDLVIGCTAFAHQLTDLAVGVHDRGVVAPPEQLTDLGQGQLRELTAEVHRDLPGGDQDSRARRATEILHGEAEVDRGLRHDRRGRDLVVLVLREDVLEHDLSQVEVDELTVEAGERRDPDERALELTDVRGDPAGDELQHLIGG